MGQTTPQALHKERQQQKRGSQSSAEQNAAYLHPVEHNRVDV